MSIEIKQKTVDLVFTDSADGILKGWVVPQNQSHDKNDKVLRLHFMLMGESSPEFSPLTVEYPASGRAMGYRYDWMVGVTPIYPCYEWDWWNTIGEQRAIIVQMLIDSGASGCGFTEITAELLALPQSKELASQRERAKAVARDGLTILANLAEPLSQGAAALMKTTAGLSGLAAGAGKEHQNWFLYRFVDETRKCGVVEWNVSRDALHQYGPLLRGSIVLAFHGNQKPAKPLTLLLRPLMNFSKGMDYGPPAEDLEKEDPVAISIQPIPKICAE